MNYRKNRLFPLFISVILACSLTGCSKALPQDLSGISSETPDDSKTTSDEDSANSTLSYEEMFSSRDIDGEYDSSEAIVIHLSDDNSTCADNSVTIKDNIITITKEATYLLTGTLSDGQIVVDADNAKVQLVLDHADITCKSSAAIYVLSADKVFLTLAENSKNSLSTTEEFVAIDDNNIDAAIFSKDDITLNGTGTLSVTCKYGHGIVSKDDLKVTGGTYEITAAGHGLSGKDSIRIADGSFEISATGDGLHTDSLLVIYEGNISIAQSEEGLEGSTVIINGGNISIASNDDGINASGDVSDIEITINGGIIRVDANGDGIDSNGSLTVNGGEVYVAGPSDNGNFALDFEKTGTITGGTVVACGSSGMAQNFGTSSTQCSMLVNLDSTTTDTVVLTDSSSNELVSFSPDKSYNCVVISTPAVMVGETYTVSCGSNNTTIEMSDVIYGESSHMGGGKGGGMPDGMDGGMGRPSRDMDGEIPFDRDEMNPPDRDGRMPFDKVK